MKHPISVRLIHWSSVVIIFGLLTLGLYMTPFDMDNMAFSENLYHWHKSFGILALLFVVVRMINIRLNKPLELPEGMPANEKFAAKSVHYLLYALILIIPILGYIQSSAYEFSSGVHFFFIDLPQVVPDNKVVFDLTNFLHKWASYVLIAVLVAHIAGALKHRFFDKENDVLNRMI